MELGGDSLKLVECVFHLEEAFNIGLDITEMGTNASVNGIARYIQDKMQQGSANRKKINLQEECYLDDEMTASPGEYSGSASRATAAAPGEAGPASFSAYTHSVNECRRLFLTGSTGFLGAFLIRSLLEQFAGLVGQDITIYCYVRAKDEATGLKRIVDNMKRYRCWNDKYAQRIQAVTGSLSYPSAVCPESP